MTNKTTYTKHIEMSADEMANLAVWDRVVLRAWQDPEFRQKLTDDPNAVLSELGFKIPAGVRFVVVENTPDRRHIVLPSAPSGDVSVLPLDTSPLHDYDPGF
ncbi:NHLP leader peptide family RiPP precursor [Polyangium jinanense]|uniref:NHLP leader peptide family RiPP precursor n=1 Tax=Polyangium jinanense TaxID=2829994 RepID=UPI00233F9077|nr:NHLP leader peptide family RiPP precursor [Polyangium jinanense]MDC3958858.1 NHLP leader peptide family RiPP precursor [Polyangium jinanense]